MAVLQTLLGLLLIAFGGAGAFNVHRSRDRIVRINRSRPPGDRARSVAGIPAWCGVSVLVGLLLLLHGLG